jgi:hypothetical protein
MSIKLGPLGKEEILILIGYLISLLLDQRAHVELIKKVKYLGYEHSGRRQIFHEDDLGGEKTWFY